MERSSKKKRKKKGPNGIENMIAMHLFFFSSPQKTMEGWLSCPLPRCSISASEAEEGESGKEDDEKGGYEGWE
jgi:hypothetical protein